MLVKITDYNRGEVNFVTYQVSDLSLEQLNFLKDNLGEETDIVGDDLLIKMYFEDELYPFQSDVAKFRIDDFVARENSSSNLFLG